MKLRLYWITEDHCYGQYVYIVAAYNRAHAWRVLKEDPDNKYTRKKDCQFGLLEIGERAEVLVSGGYAE